jgi:uncharacterized membrane protein
MSAVAVPPVPAVPAVPPAPPELAAGGRSRSGTSKAQSALALTANASNAVVHFYRAEVGRMTAYRARLDTTTNWAITTSALVTTFTLGDTERTHAAFLFLMFLDYFFLQLESRRYSAYEGCRRRVRLVERYFYPQALGGEVDGRWLHHFREMLERPTFPTVSLFSAISWRLRRVYLWIYAGVLLAWLSKIDVSGFTHLDFVERAAVGSVPGWIVCLGVAALYAWLVGLAVYPGHRHPLSNPYADETLGSAQFRPQPPDGHGAPERRRSS